MSDEVQPGVRIDSSLWERFRQDVKSRRGTVRGHLRTELETAIRRYVEGGDPHSSGKVDERLSRIEDAMGIASADGGTPTAEIDEPHTHAPSEKPPSNAPTDKKLAYLEECVIDEVVPNSREIKSIPEDTIRDVVKDEYGFRRDTTRRYVEQLVERLDLEPHPTADAILVSQAERERIVSEQANDDMNEITDT